MAPPEKHYMAESSVQLADVNIQTEVPEIPMNLPVKSPVNLPDAGDPTSDSQPIQSASGVISYSFICSKTCIQSCPKCFQTYLGLFVLIWFTSDIITVVCIYEGVEQAPPVYPSDYGQKKEHLESTVESFVFDI